MDETRLTPSTPSHPPLGPRGYPNLRRTAAFVRLRQLAGRLAGYGRGLGSRLLATTRLSRVAVCQESATLGEYDYHTHRDDPTGAPWFVEGGRRCGRCGKRFRV